MYSHGNVCTFDVLSFFLFFPFSYSMHFSMSSDCFFSSFSCLSLSPCVIVVRLQNSSTCSTMMRVAFSVIHIFIHNKPHANCFDSCLGTVLVVFLELCVCVCVYMYMRNGNPRIFYRQNIDSTGSFS